MSEITLRLQVDPVELKLASAAIEAMAVELSASIALVVEKAMADFERLLRETVLPDIIVTQAPPSKEEIARQAIPEALVAHCVPNSDSGAGERRDATEEGVHPAPTSPSSGVSSLNLPGVPASPASFSGPETRAEARPTPWSSERDDLLIALRAQGAKWPDVWKRLNELPGVKIASPGAVEVHWYKLKKIGLTGAPAPSAGTVQARPAGEVLMTIPQARKWAAERGLCNGVGATLDMKLVNAKREALGLPRIKLEGR